MQNLAQIANHEVLIVHKVATAFSKKPLRDVDTTIVAAMRPAAKSKPSRNFNL